MTSLKIEWFRTLEALPSLPGQMLVLLDEISQCSAMDYNLLERIQYDPSMAFRVLKVANLPVYGYAERITSLHQAAGLLGPGAIRNLVLTTPILERFQDPVYVEREMDFQKIWLHASVTGALAGSLAGRIGNLEPDVCFTAGLIHPVGTIALAVHHPRILLEVLQLAEKQGGSRVDAERRVLGFTHAEVAADMAAAANFPPALVQSVRSLAASEGEDEGPSMGALVQLARSLAIEWGYADGLGREVPVDRKRLLAVFKISAGDLIKWTPQLKEFVNPAVQALG